MQNSSVLIISEEGQNELYRALLLKRERVGIRPLREARKSMIDWSADIIVLDCGRNINGGLNLLKEIKKIRRDIPIIFITEDNSKDGEIEARRSGARQFFKKPLTIFEIENAALSLLKAKRASREKRLPFTTTVEDEYSEQSEGIRVTNDKKGCLTRAVRHMEANLSDKITLEGLAKEASLSKYHFCRIFRRHFGMTPMRFVTSMRIERAKTLLKREDHNMSETAMEAGFNDLGTFIRQFKKFTGITPAAYKIQ